MTSLDRSSKDKMSHNHETTEQANLNDHTKVKSANAKPGLEHMDSTPNMSDSDNDSKIQTLGSIEHKNSSTSVTQDFYHQRNSTLGEARRRLQVGCTKHTKQIDLPSLKLAKKKKKKNFSVTSFFFLMDMITKTKELLWQNNLMDELSEDRLEDLMSNIEGAICGEDVLIPEDLLEFGMYLSSNESTLQQKAIELFKQNFKARPDDKDDDDSNGRGYIRSKLGEMYRPINGDLIVDIICDAITANEGQEQIYDLIQLLGITGQVCTLRHGFTRIFELYNWALTREDEEKGQAIMPSAEQQALANAILEAATQTVILKGPDIYLSTTMQVTSSKQIHEHTLTVLPDIAFARLPKGWSFSFWMKLGNNCEENLYDVFYFQNDTNARGLRIALEVTRIAAMGAFSFGFVVQPLPLEDHTKISPMKSQRITQSVNLVVGRWHFIVLTQLQARLFICFLFSVTYFFFFFYVL
ncbi:hypothetical protein RFI_15149, partial [Reticulomyxa filosa]